ncbi:hypothetical protein [Shouchella patagoniensis]|uniref:hypothetical protein n=1 Tax=Shouchella patagoniensis TaxID=228576 RepID=UPI000995A89C|nr:hypothetical protein [Shouchella patagoniensis]
MLTDAIYAAILFAGAIQFMNGGFLWLMGFPSMYSKYLEGFYTKKPEQWHEYLFNVLFWVLMSGAYFSMKKLASKHSFWKTKLYYGIGLIVAFLVFMLVVIPILAAIIP